MRCDVWGIWAWGNQDDTCYKDLSNAPAGLDGDLLASTMGAECAGPEIWILSWALRRQLWRDLVAAGSMEITLNHDHEDGCGSASMLFLSERAPGVTFDAPDFLLSDAFYANYAPEVGIFSLLTEDSWSGWPEFALENMEYEEFDDADLYEHSFRSVDRVVVNSAIALSMVSWAAVPEDLQVRAVTALVFDQRAQIAEYEEVLLGHEDVLAAIAAHPETSVAAWGALAADCEECCREILLANLAVPAELRVIAGASGR